MKNDVVSHRFQLAAARRRLEGGINKSGSAKGVSTRSRAKAAGGQGKGVVAQRSKFQLAAARRRLEADTIQAVKELRFQLAAARRRLGCSQHHI